MKKLIAILVIAIVMVGAVFAENVAPNVGTANLKVVTLVGVVEPEFKLTTATSDSGVLVGTPATVAIMDDATPADDANADAYHVIAKNALVSSTAGSTTVTFYVEQTNACKSYKTYSFSASAGNLVMVKAYNADGELVAYTGTATVDNHRVFALVGNGAVNTFASTGAADQFTGNLIDTASTSSLYKITYTGDEVLAGKVASFTCTWTNDVNGVPGQYEADIRLTVTAN